MKDIIYHIRDITYHTIYITYHIKDITYDIKGITFLHEKSMEICWENFGKKFELFFGYFFLVSARKKT